VIYKKETSFQKYVFDHFYRTEKWIP